MTFQTQDKNQSNSKYIEMPTDIEMLVLGAFLNSTENTKIGLKLVHDCDFIEKKHKIIFKAIQDVFTEKNIIDISLIHHKLTSECSLKETEGGAPYLIELAQIAGTSCHIEAYCEDLKKLTVKRQLISLNNSLSTEIKQGADESKIIEKLKDKIRNIEKHKAHAESAFRYLLDNNSETNLIEELKRTSPGVSTGFTIGNENIKIPGGAISVIALPTSHGKTATLINFSLGILNHHSDKSVYFFTYEESWASIKTLFINTYINKELSKNNRESIKSYFINGDMQFIKTDKEDVSMRADFLKDKDVFFKNLINNGRLKIFYSDMSVEELVASIHFIKKNTNVGLVCIDYMQMLKLLKSNQISRQEELKQICLILKDCAIETGLPIMLGAQFNRQVVSEADLSPTQIGEAGDIERIASLIIGGWNRNFAGFTKEGNKNKAGKLVPVEPAIYFEILKGRGIGNGHNSVMDFNGNTGKLINRIFSKKTSTCENYDSSENEIICKL